MNMNLNTEHRSANWHGRTHRTLNQAFGPYHSENFSIPGEANKRKNIGKDILKGSLTCVGLAALWFISFWVLAAYV